MGFDLIFQVHTRTKLPTHKSHSSADWMGKMYLRLELKELQGKHNLDVYAAAVRLFIQGA